MSDEQEIPLVNMNFLQLLQLLQNQMGSGRIDLALGIVSEAIEQIKNQDASRRAPIDVTSKEGDEDVRESELQDEESTEDSSS